MAADRLLIAALALFATGTFLWFQGRILGADLMALWLAGQFLADGQPGLVYPADMGIFTMYAPNDWVVHMRAEYGHYGPIFPFLYPPLWAWVAGFFAQSDGFAVIAYIALPINCILLAASIWLAIRITAPRMPGLVFAALAGALLFLTPIGKLALLQVQPQILVSFLILLAIERSRYGAPAAAGIAMALAASLKLYPALFVLFWLASGHKRAAAWFLLAGAALAAASVALAGWPLHQEFLRQMSQMSGTVFLTKVSANLDAVIAQVFFSDSLTLVPALNSAGLTSAPTGWLIMARPAAWSLLGGLSLLLMSGIFWWGFRRAAPPVQYSALWPLVLITSAILAPFNWIYYFIPAAVLVPALVDRLGVVRGGFFLMAGFLPVFLPMLDVYKTLHFIPYVFPLAAVSGMSIWALGFVLVAIRRAKAD